MIAFGRPSCSLTDAGIYSLGDEDRVFIATPNSLSIDCCRTTTDAGSPINTTAAYMIVLSRE